MSDSSGGTRNTVGGGSGGQSVSTDGGASGGQFGITDAGASDTGGSDGAGAGADGAGAESGPLTGPGTILTATAGLDPLVAAFPAPTGVIVVRWGHIELVSRDGTRSKLLTMPRQNTAASFDGTNLVVADRAMLTTYDASLTPLGEAPLAETCIAMDAVSNGVVCTPYHGEAPAFWTYAPGTGGARTRSTLEGAAVWATGALVRVPGRDQIMILDGASTVDWLVLYDVSAAGNVAEVATLGADSQVRNRFAAFDRTPATRLLADNGNFYRLGPADCGTTDPQSCIVLDGSLVPRSTPETMVAAVSDGAGTFQVLRAPAAIAPFCEAGCAFDSIDAATGAVRQTTTFRLSVSETVSAHYDAISGGMVLAYRSADGDRVDLLRFAAPSGSNAPAPDASAGPAPIPPAPDSPLSGCVPDTRLVDGNTRVLTAAPVPGGVLIVRYDEAVKMDRAGNVLISVPRPRHPASAVFDDGTLAIGDAQGLALYDESLNLLHEIPVTGGCNFVAVANNGRAVCEMTDPVDPLGGRIMNTYAVGSGALLASSSFSSAIPRHGRPLRRVPGVGALVSPTQFAFTYSLYAVAPNGTVSFVNTSLSQQPMATVSFALWGSGPSGALPVHLVAQSGDILKIYDPDCLTSGAPFHAGCFMVDGEVGSQWGDQRLVTMADDGQDTLFAVTADVGDHPFPPSARCASDCLLVQRIDLPSRRVISTRMHSLPMTAALATEADAECGMLLVLYTTGGGDAVEPSSTTTYRVELFDYGAAQ